jgi:ATP-dependent Lhr-like helicase
MFISRWRWNLNRALLVLRYRGGRKNPPPIQRMEADDFMAALFPQAAACQENITGPIEIPDHLIVRQTVHDTLTEGLDVDGLRTLLRKIEGGTVRVHTVDTTEPSVLAHEILTARPYAFLDDEEAQNRRTNAVPIRRGLNVDLTAIGELDPDAIARVHKEITPVPQTPDDLHDLLCALVRTKPRAAWTGLFGELEARGRAYALVHEGEPLWCATEMLAEAANVDTGDDDAIVGVVRGHLDLAGVTTAAQLAAVCGLTDGQTRYALAALEQRGEAMQGAYTRTREETEWVARRLLARMHAYSRKSRRERVEPATAQDFMRFLLRWQHLAPGTQLHGDGGLATVIAQLQGWEAAAAAWEPELLARRMRTYNDATLDRLCHDGEVGWLRLAPPARDADTPAGPPSKATPISVVFRADLPWLLTAARTDGDPVEPASPATAAVIEVLRERGACFATDLRADVNHVAEDVERALWEGVTRGLIASDGFGAIRRKVDNGAVTPVENTRLSRLMRGGRAPGPAAGRWSLVPPVTDAFEREELAEAVAEMLLRRWGVLFRDLWQRESIRFPWRDVQRALRRLEDRGLVRGGRFVSGFTGEQYALPEAVEQLNAIRKTERTGERVTVNATDPCNLVGLVVPGARVPSVRTNSVIYVDGVAIESTGSPSPAV